MIWRIYYKKLGGHVHCRVFCGPQEGALGKCGDLSFREREFTEFTRLRKVLAMDFRNEIDEHGEKIGDYAGVVFDRLT
jgi:hypothetical protein